mgnify:CR=1 FL=1
MLSSAAALLDELFEHPATELATPAARINPGISLSDCAPSALQCGLWSPIATSIVSCPKCQADQPDGRRSA